MKRNTVTCLILTVFIGILFSFPDTMFESEAYANGVLIIGSKTVADTSLTKADIKRIFLGKKTKWSDNQKIIFVTSKQKSLQKKFLKQYIGKTPSQFKRFWRKKVFQGEGVTPKSFKTDKDLAEFVSSTDGAIGYISSGSAEGDIITISVTN